jgi:Fe-S-cluster-containing dehydrogenase component
MTTEKKPTLKKHSLMVDGELCIGCQTCQVACKLEHGLPAGPRPIAAIQIGPLLTQEGLITQFWPASCHHCDQPACVIACPTGAMQKRKDGLVFSDRQLCIGCQTCAVACPFGHPQLNPATGKIVKCDGCQNRVDQGLWPACALKCPTGALSFGTLTAVVHARRTKEALRVTETFTHTKC